MKIHTLNNIIPEKIYFIILKNEDFMEFTTKFI